jgi:hypothetical protein
LNFSFPTAKLQDYAGKTEALLASHNPFAWVTLAHLRTQQARHDPDQLLAAKWYLTKLLYQHRWSKPRIIVLFKVLNWMMALPSSYQERYWQAIRSLEKEHKMEWLSPLEQSFLDKGREEGLKRGLREGRKEGWEDGLEKGLEKGLAKGRKEGAVAVLERQLTRRFGPLSETTRKKLTRASLPQLEAWGDALPEAQTLKQVFG